MGGAFVSGNCVLDDVDTQCSSSWATVDSATHLFRSWALSAATIR